MTLVQKSRRAKVFPRAKMTRSRNKVFIKTIKNKNEQKNF